MQSRGDAIKHLVAIPRAHVDGLKRHRETGLGYQVVSVILRNGKRFDQVVASEGCVIQVRGHRDIPFSADDVASIAVNHAPWNFRGE